MTLSSLYHAVRVLLSATLLTSAAAHAEGLTFSGPLYFPNVAAPVYSVRVDALAGGHDDMLFSKTDSSAAFPGDPAFRTSTLSYVTSTLAAYIDVYNVNAGETFADSSLAMSATGPGSLPNGHILERLDRVSVKPTYFYLGVRTYLDPAYNGGQSRSALGWLYLQNTQSQGLRLVDSFLAYNASSIVIGQVPEASAWSLASLGVLTVLGAALTRNATRGTRLTPR